MKILEYTQMLFGASLEGEMAWYEKVCKDASTCLWAIATPDNTPIGVTGLHELNLSGGCTSGIIIWDQSWWGKGVASAAHLMRTLFATDYLARLTINSCVRVPNEASKKALERVGYTIWGTEPPTVFRGGGYLSTHHLTWINPERTDLVFSAGIPLLYRPGIDKARVALQKAREVVKF